MSPAKACRGCRRFNRDTLEIKYKGNTIADVLGMTVNQAFLFRKCAGDQSKSQTLIDVGSAYITSANLQTLSGGEAQRVKLQELSKGRQAERSIFRRADHGPAL
jgi:excinuclease ABC subunit A